MIIDPLKTGLASVDVARGRYAIREPSGKVHSCTLRQWAEWGERNGMQPVHMEGRPLTEGSILAVVFGFFGQGLFESPPGFYWKVMASVGGQEAAWYVDSEAEGVKLAKHVARVGIEEQAMSSLIPL